MCKPNFKGLSFSIAAALGSCLHQDTTTPQKVHNVPGKSWARRTYSKVFRRKQAKSCLYCGNLHTHNNAFCSAAHCKLWEADNPGKGSLVHETWVKMTPDDLYFEDREMQSDIYQMEEGPFMIKHNRGGHGDYMLHKFDEVSWQIVKIFSCLIDTKREGARQLRSSQ